MRLLAREEHGMEVLAAQENVDFIFSIGIWKKRKRRKEQKWIKLFYYLQKVTQPLPLGSSEALKCLVNITAKLKQTIPRLFELGICNIILEKLTVNIFNDDMKYVCCTLTNFLWCHFEWIRKFLETKNHNWLFPQEQCFIFVLTLPSVLKFFNKQMHWNYLLM